MEAAALASEVARPLALGFARRFREGWARAGCGDEGGQFSGLAIALPAALILSIAAFRAVTAEAALVTAIAAILERLTLIVRALGVTVLIWAVLIRPLLRLPVVTPTLVALAPVIILALLPIIIIEARPLAIRLRRLEILRLVDRLRRQPLGDRGEAVGEAVIDVVVVVLVGLARRARIAPHLRLLLRLVGGGDDAEIMLGVLQIALRTHGIAGGLRVARQLQVLFCDVLGGTADFHVGPVRFVAPRQRIGPLAAGIAAAHALILTRSHR